MWNDDERTTRVGEELVPQEGEAFDRAGRQPGASDGATSLDKALDLCEALSQSPRGLSISDLSRQLRRPAPTVHRLLGVLKRRGYVQQDEETSR